MKTKSIWLWAVVCLMLVSGTAMVLTVEDCDSELTSNRYVTNITPTSVVVHWNYPPIPTNAMVIRYRESGTFNWDYVFHGNPALDCNQSGYAISSNNHYQHYIGGLDPNTTYQWQVFRMKTGFCGDSCPPPPGLQNGPPFTTTTGSGKQAGSGPDVQSDVFAMEVYPNPAHSELNVRFAGEALDREACVVDIHGRTVCSVGMRETLESLSLRGLAEGMYVVQVREKGVLVGQERFFKVRD